MQIVNYKIIFVSVVIIFTAINICFAKGKRKNFLSHGPSVSSFAQGETVLNNINDPSVIFYNPSLIPFFTHNGINVSRYNLFEGTSYNTISADIKLLSNLYAGFSAINLSVGDVELRKDAYDSPKTVNPGQWEYILSAASVIKAIDVSLGINTKYIYMDLYEKKDGGFSFDFSASKYFKDVDLKYTQALVGIGFTAQNIFGTGIKLDEYREDFQNIFVLSSMISIPIKFRFDNQDIFTLSLDVRNEDGYSELYAGAEYKLYGKYALRTGYYNEHITAGFGADVKFISVNYAMDFNDIDIINRFSLSYRWSRKYNYKDKNSLIAAEANAALAENENIKKTAQEEFNKAKYFYSKKQYIYATEIFQKLIVKYPNYESTNFYYNKIQKIMKDNSSSQLLNSFAEYTYAAGFVNYYKGNYPQALKEWMKYLQFEPENKEIKEYYEKVQKILNDYRIEMEKKEFEITASKMLKEGIIYYNNKKLISCIKQMEKVQNFVSNYEYAPAFDYYNKAKKYIEQSVKELAEAMKSQITKQDKNLNSEHISEKNEFDEKTANEKYREGLILYARGKYKEAENMWHLTLRLNPNHLKAKNALKHIAEDKKQ